MHSFIAIALVRAFQWILFGYSLAFGPDIKGLDSEARLAASSGVGSAPNADYAPRCRNLAFMAYQMMFAVITPALISGAFAERIKFFSISPIHAALDNGGVRSRCALGLGGGRMDEKLGALDFAGGSSCMQRRGLCAPPRPSILESRQGLPA